MLILLLCFQAWNRGDDLRSIFRDVLTSAVGYISGMLIFQIFIMQPISDTGYVSSSLLPFNQLIPGAIQHYKEYCKLVLSDFRPLWFAWILALVVSFVLSSVFQSKCNKLLSLLFSVGTVLGMFLLSFGLYPFLTKSLMATRAMYGVGAFIALSAVYAVSRPKTVLSKVTAVAVSWCFFVFASVYGNALSVQKEYSNFRTVMVIDDLKDLEAFQGEEPVVFDITGATLYAPQLKVTFEQYGILKRLVHPAFSSGSWTWNHREFQDNYGIPNLGPYRNLSDEQLPLLKDTMYHTIYGKDNMIRIELK